MSIFQKIKSFFIPKKMLFIIGISVCLFLFFPMNSLAQQNVYQKGILHHHTGNSESGGGCYSLKKTGTNTEKIKCDGTMNYWAAYNTTTCSRCGASYSGDQSGRGCWYEETETTYYTYYDLGCGLEEGACVGTLTVTQSTTDWAKSLVLTASYANTGNMTVYNPSFIWNGTQPSGSSTYGVNANGTYTLQLNADENSDTQSAVLTIDVRNIDVTAPMLKTHSIEPASAWTKDGVTVALVGAVDLQPDGSAGSGLHETPYSYDGGKSWTAESSHHYTENGTYSIFVRDRLGNNSSYTISFGNVDNAPPVIKSVEFDHTENIPLTEIVVSASDLQPDGSAGSGLHETPYSFDGGKTWSADNTFAVTQNGTVKIAVRDQLGNIVYREENIQNLDRTAPKFSYTMSTEFWTNKEVSLHLSASDVNEDGTDGSGLADTWYSLDNGKTWSGEEILVFEKNIRLAITVRDRNDNTSTVWVNIDQIDKEEPSVLLNMEILEDGLNKKVKLQAQGEDDDSGLHEEAYSWDGGNTFSDQDTKIITENGTYQVHVRDKAGNCSNAVIEVDVFPAPLPELPFFPEEEESTEVETEEETTEIETDMESEEEVTEIETDMESEVAETETGSDKEAGSEIENRKEHEAESETETIVETEAETETLTENVVKPKEKNNTELNAEVETETETEPETGIVTEITTVTLEERIENPPITSVETIEKEPLWEVMLRVLGLMLITVFVIISIFFIWSRTIAVYVKKANGRKQYMGRLWILRRDERYVVTIRDSLVEKAMTMCFCFRPSLLFVDFHKDEEIHFLFPEGVCITLTIERNMEME